MRPGWALAAITSAHYTVIMSSIDLGPPDVVRVGRDPGAGSGSTRASVAIGFGSPSGDTGVTRLDLNDILVRQARAMLEEDLRSPCTEEIAVFRAFAQTVDQARDAFVVLDTAPTGHTVLLMDSAEAYHREVSRTQGDMPASVRSLLPRLRDPAFTRVLIVTLAEATPVHEAERLQEDLRRAQIEPYAWVINQSLLASGTHDPLLSQRGVYEVPFIERVRTKASRRCALIPWLVATPVGAAALSLLVVGRPSLEVGPAAA